MKRKATPPGGSTSQDLMAFRGMNNSERQQYTVGKPLISPFQWYIVELSTHSRSKMTSINVKGAGMFLYAMGALGLVCVLAAAVKSLTRPLAYPLS